MKVRNILIVISALSLTFSLTTSWAAETYLGEFCWRIVADGEPFDDGSIFKLGVYQKDGGHFALYGIYDEDNAVHGNAELVGNVISMTLSGSADYGDEIVSETIQATLNSTSLSGEAHTVGIQVDPVSRWAQNFYVPHTMTFVSCP